MAEDLWGECVGTARLCDDDGMVRTDWRYPDGYQCTGGRHTGYKQYIRCDNPRHVVQVARYTLLPSAGTHCPGCQCSHSIAGLTFLLPGTWAAAHTYTATCAGHHRLTEPCPGKA